MTTKIRKWGNSYAVRISKAKMRELGIREGSHIEIKIKPVERKYTLDDLLSKMTPENVHPLIDFGPDVGKERWEY
jgi:antitoxin MazE